MLLIAAPWTWGCAYRVLAEESAGPLGCSADAIVIDHPNLPLEGPQWWWATCSEREPPRRYFCSRLKSDLICSDVPPDADDATSAAQAPELDRPTPAATLALSAE